MIEPTGPAHYSAIQDIRPHRLPWIIEQIRALLHATGLSGGDGFNNEQDARGDSVKRLPQTASKGGSEPKERSLQSTQTDLKRPAAPNRLTRLDYLLAALVACISFVIYLLTVAPGLLMNDSGEFQTLAATFGYTHPTGYPSI